MPRAELIIPITVAVIAVVGSLIPVFINNPNIRDKPQVYVSTETKVVAGNFQTDMKIGNSGSAPATNISVALESTAKITNVTRLLGITEVFTNETKQLKLGNLESMAINSKILELFIPKLIPGEGSMVRLKLNFEFSAINPHFNVLTVYDQGSTSATGGIKTAIDFLSELFITYSSYYSFLLFVITFAYTGFVAYAWRKRHTQQTYLEKKRETQETISQMIDYLLAMQRELNLNIFTEHLFQSDVFQELPHEPSSKVKSVKDYIIISNLIEKLNERNEHINPTDTNLVKINWETLSLINLALDIDWDKYL